MQKTYWAIKRVRKLFVIPGVIAAFQLMLAYVHGLVGDLEDRLADVGIGR